MKMSDYDLVNEHSFITRLKRDVKLKGFRLSVGTTEDEFTIILMRYDTRDLMSEAVQMNDLLEMTLDDLALKIIQTTELMMKSEMFKDQLK